MSKLFALVDCNNFFASCERVFNPALKNKPVVVLSNNDGCIIARSNEAKALGIGMAEPVFKCRDTIERHNVRVYSANFVLYGDMSARVMNTLARFTPEMEIYSIDEAFLVLEGIGTDPYEFAKSIKECVRRDTGMPISIGVAATKTLAKIANHIAKKHCIEGVFCLLEEPQTDHWLEKTPVEEIWGIGRNKAQLLKRNGILTALQFKATPEAWVKKHLTLSSLKTQRELQGEPCLVQDDISSDKKAITTSRTFSQDVTDKEELVEAVAGYTAMAAQKLRRQEGVCGYLQVYVETSRFKRARYYANCAGIDITPPSAYTPLLIKTARDLVERIYKDGYAYKKAGVLLSNLQTQGQEQDFLFDENYANSPKHRLMSVIDRINRRTNRGKIFIAAEGVHRPWAMAQSHRSRRFTTQWDELLEIRL